MTKYHQLISSTSHIFFFFLSIHSSLPFLLPGCQHSFLARESDGDIKSFWTDHPFKKLLLELISHHAEIDRDTRREAVIRTGKERGQRRMNRKKNGVLLCKTLTSNSFDNKHKILKQLFNQHKNRKH